MAWTRSGVQVLVQSDDVLYFNSVPDFAHNHVPHKDYFVPFLIGFILTEKMLLFITGVPAKGTSNPFGSLFYNRQ